MSWKQSVNSKFPLGQTWYLNNKVAPFLSEFKVEQKVWTQKSVFKKMKLIHFTSNSWFRYYFFHCVKYLARNYAETVFFRKLPHQEIRWNYGILRSILLREKCLNTEFFPLRKSPYSVRIQQNTDQKKLRIWTLFTQCLSLKPYNYHLK